MIYIIYLPLKKIWIQPILVSRKAPFRSNLQKKRSSAGHGPHRDHCSVSLSLFPSRPLTRSLFHLSISPSPSSPSRFALSPSPSRPLQLLTLSISPSASLLLPRPLLLLLCNFCNIYLQAKGFFIKEAWFLKYLKSIFWLFYFPYLRCLYQENLFNLKDECLFLGKPCSLKIYI